VAHKVTSPMNERLLGEFTREEIKEAVDQILLNPRDLMVFW
jgi:hypothetical protein